MNGQPKHYLFETETKKLKEFYAKNLDLLMQKRIIFNNSLGTVRYVGQLKHEGKPANCEGQIWVGLQWDEQGRGKHNGTVKDYEYFSCANNKGSLVKFEKIQFGYKLETALFKRYFRVEQMHHAKDIYESLKAYKEEFKHESQEQKNKKCEQMVKKIHKTEYDSEAYVETLSKERKIMVEFIGFDQIWTKLNNLEKLQSISLAECRICDLGPKGHLSGILTNLKILSMQDNMISNWNQVFQLGAQLKNLRQLSLTNNKIAAPTQSFSSLSSFQIQDHGQSYPLNGGNIFQNLECLILINTGLTWKTLFMISQAFDNKIQQLILCRNDMSDIENIDEEKIKKMKELVFLNVQDTKQSTFEGIKKFHSLKNLEKLIVNRNPIKQLGKIQGFDNLKHLSVQYCDISDAVVVYQISQFSQIESLNIKHNPVGERMGNSHIRMRSVAELPKLKIINGAQLRKYQRKDCQIYYMRQSFKQYFTLKNVTDYEYDYEDFMKYCQVHHPGIQYFINKYGNPYQVQQKKQIKQMVKQEVKQVEKKKGTGMIQVRLLNKLIGSNQLKKLPVTWTVNSLKNFFSKVYKIPVPQQRITYKIQQNDQEEQMTENHKSLSHYNLYNESIIIVDLVN